MNKKELKKLDKNIEQEYYKQGHGVQINIMDITKVFRDCREDVTQNGLSLEMAVSNAIAKYRMN